MFLFMTSKIYKSYWIMAVLLNPAQKCTLNKQLV